MMDVSNIGLATALLGGVISFLSPCVLPLVPGYVSYVAGRPIGKPGDGGLTGRLRVMGLSLCFVLGFSTIFVIFGASATALGQAMLAYRYELNIAGGAIVVLFGLMMIGFIRLSWLQKDLRFSSPAARGRPASAYVLGLAFAFGWTPCIGPILGAILTINAVSATVTQGITLLSVYSLGLGIPFLLTALFADGMTRRLKSAGRFGGWFRISAGLVMIVMGIAMMTDQLTVFSYWLLDVLPALAYIG